jgi:hypothetical protein
MFIKYWFGTQPANKNINDRFNTFVEAYIGVSFCNIGYISKVLADCYNTLIIGHDVNITYIKVILLLG